MLLCRGPSLGINHKHSYEYVYGLVGQTTLLRNASVPGYIAEVTKFLVQL